MQLRNTRTVYGLYPEANHLFYGCPPPEQPIDTAKPEKNLMWAILLRAVQDVTDNIGQGWCRERIREDARSWLFDDEFDARTPFTYQHICLTLDIDPDQTRKWILKLKEPVYRNKSRNKLAA